MGCLYCLTFPDGQRYIGITKHTAEQRLAQHFYERSSPKGMTTPFGMAIQAAGREAITVETWVIAPMGPYLKALEMAAIKAFRTFKPYGLNATIGGNGVTDPSGEGEALRRARAKVTRATAASRALRSSVMKAAWTPEKKAIRAEMVRQKWQDPEYRAKMLAAPQRSPEGLERLWAARWDDPVMRDRMSQWMAAKMRELWSAPEFRAKFLAKRWPNSRLLSQPDLFPSK